MERLRRRRLPGGAFPNRPGGEARVEATAWAALALQAAGDPVDAIKPSLEWLAARQLADGRVPLAPDVPDVAWPTPLAMLAWSWGGWNRERIDRAAGFLLAHEGQHRPKAPDDPLGHDTDLRGWSWVLGSHAWVVPTALAVLALRQAGLGGHARVAEAVRLLLDRQLPGGGWNYGNTTVFGQVLRPQPDTTGVALCALAGAAGRETIARSLDYLERVLARVRTPLSLGWGVLGLADWSARPLAADMWIEETLGREPAEAPYDTPSLAVLSLAAHARRGLTAVKGA